MRVKTHLIGSKSRLPRTSSQTSSASGYATSDQITDEFISAITTCTGFKCEDAACHSRRVGCMKRASAIARRLLDTPPSSDQPRRLARAYVDATQTYEELVTLAIQGTRGGSSSPEAQSEDHCGSAPGGQKARARRKSMLFNPSYSLSAKSI